MNTSKTTLTVQLIWLAASVLFWPILIAGSWVFMPPLLAAMSSAVHIIGFFLTAFPAIFYLLGAHWRPSGSSRQGSHRGDSFCSGRGENREATSLHASRSTSPDSGSFSAGHNDVLPLVTGRGPAPGGGHPDPLDIPTIWRLSDEAIESGFSHLTPIPVSIDVAESSGTGEEEEA